MLLESGPMRISAMWNVVARANHDRGAVLSLLMFYYSVADFFRHQATRPVSLLSEHICALRNNMKLVSVHSLWCVLVTSKS